MIRFSDRQYPCLRTGEDLRNIDCHVRSRQFPLKWDDLDKCEPHPNYGPQGTATAEKIKITRGPLPRTCRCRLCRPGSIIRVDLAASRTRANGGQDVAWETSLQTRVSKSPERKDSCS